MAERIDAKWPVSEQLAAERANGRTYLSAKEAADLYEMAYSTFVRRLKDFVLYGEYPPQAFRVARRLNPSRREYWAIEVHPVFGIRALNRHLYPRLAK